MSTITATMVKELRDRTGQAMMDCKKALGETDGDIDKAIALLRKKGMAVMEKRGERETHEGKVLVQTAADGKRAAMIMLCCETDFTAKNDEFVKTAESIVAGLLAVDTPPDSTGALGQVDGGDGQKVADLVNSVISKTGEKISIGDFTCFALSGPGLIHSYVHFNGKIGAMLHLETESDEAASQESLKGLAGDLAMHITAHNPEAISRDEIDADLVAKEKEIALSQVKGKPEHIIDKIVEGKLNKWFKETVLLEQPFVKDDSKSVNHVIEDVGKSVGSKITLRKFVRMQVG